MRYRVLFLGWLACVAIGSLAPGYGGDAAKRPRRALEGVKELEKPITLSETKIPLGELVQKVAAQTMVPLTAAPDVADEPVAVVVKELPARELLEELSDLLDYTWSRRSGASGRTGNAQGPTPNAQGPTPTYYEIWQDLAGKQREEALREATRAAVEKRLRQELDQCVAMAALPPEQIQGILDAEDKQAPKLTKETEPLAGAPVERERRHRADLARKLSSPITRALAGLLGRLSPQQWATLRLDRPLTFSTEPQPGELPLPAGMAATLRAAPPSLLPPGRRAPDDAGLQEWIFRREQETRDQWAAASGYRVAIRLEDNLLKTGGSLFLAANVTPFRKGAPPQRFFAPGTQIILSAQPGDSQPGVQAADREPGVRPDPGQEPLLGARKSFQPEARPHADAADPRSGPTWQLGQLLPDLARTYGVDLIADAYWNAAPVPAAAVATTAPVTLVALLDGITGSTRRWESRGRLIRLRSRTWFFERPQEVPLRLVRRWQALYREHGALPLDECVQIAASLNDGQVESLTHLVSAAGLPQDVAGIPSARIALRLYAVLAPPQRQALWQGQTLAVAQMSPPQRELFLAALEEGNLFQSTPQNLANWTDGSLSLTAEPSVRLIQQVGESKSYGVVTLRFDFRYEPDMRKRVSLTAASVP